MLHTKVLSSLVKVFSDEEPKAPFFPRFTMLQGEALHFQLAWSWQKEHEDEPMVLNGMKFRVELPEGVTDDMLEWYGVENVPCQMPAYPVNDGYYERTEPGLFPDVLRPATLPMRVPAGQWQSIWFTFRPGTELKGDFRFTLVFEDLSGTALSTDAFTAEVLPAALPDQTMLFTEWFHVDGITGYYNVEPYSEKCWELIESFMRIGAGNGLNLILTPVLTPPLDTQVGGERTTVQLVDITVKDGKYSFDWSKLYRWIETCKRAGIANLEISHMYTQWGAKNAPKVMATVYDDAAPQGEVRRIFGWETDAAGEEYRAFLSAMIPELLKVLEETGMQDHAWFHISDEPGLQHLEQYRKVGDFLKSLIPGYPVMDALSNFDFYKTGAVEHPVPSSNHIEPFIEAEVQGLWTYYCCSQNMEVGNRFIGMPSERSRVLGVQFYKFDIAGFLQWGYNFYNSQYSLRKIDPYRVTDAECAFPAGDPFSVYPGEDGAIPSLRLHVFMDALQDCRAMKLAELLAGRDAVMAVLEDGIDPITFKKYPHSAEWLLSVRGRVNELIRSCL